MNGGGHEKRGSNGCWGPLCVCLFAQLNTMFIAEVRNVRSAPSYVLVMGTRMGVDNCYA